MSGLALTMKTQIRRVVELFLRVFVTYPCAHRDRFGFLLKPSRLMRRVDRVSAAALIAAIASAGNSAAFEVLIGSASNVFDSG